MLFNGANINEKIDISANHGHVRFTRDVGNITMDLNGVEQIQLTARGGADTISVGDLSGTGVTRVALDLAGMPGSNIGDGATDSVTVNGTARTDMVQVSGQGGSVSLPACRRRSCRLASRAAIISSSRPSAATTSSTPPALPPGTCN